MNVELTKEQAEYTANALKSLRVVLDSQGDLTRDERVLMLGVEVALDKGFIEDARRASIVEPPLSDEEQALTEPDREYTENESEEQDGIDSSIYTLVNDSRKDGTPPIEWDIEWISEIRDIMQSVLCTKETGLTEYQFYPYRRTE